MEIGCFGFTIRETEPTTTILVQSCRRRSSNNRDRVALRCCSSNGSAWEGWRTKNDRQIGEERLWMRRAEILLSFNVGEILLWRRTKRRTEKEERQKERKMEKKKRRRRKKRGEWPVRERMKIWLDKTSGS